MQSNQQAEETSLVWDDEDDIADEKKFDSNWRQNRNTWSRPGGSNDPSKGRPLYW